MATRAQTRHPAGGGVGSAHGVASYIRRNLPASRQGGPSDPAGLILAECNIEATNLHLAEIAAAVAPGAHAALIFDGAGWHVSDNLTVPPQPQTLGVSAT